MQARKGEKQSGYMLDAETCAAILRRTEPSDATVAARLQQIAVGDVCISAVTLSELMHGVEVSRRSAQDRAALEVLLRHVAVLEYPANAAEHYGVMRMVLELSQVRLETQEILAAAHARSLGMTLVSSKAREIAKAQGMMVESWMGG
jgi:tRNA(fMet)-specific endonuclease VapC